MNFGQRESLAVASEMEASPESIWEASTMKPKVIFGLIAMAALAPVAWAGNQAAKDRNAAAGQTHARPASKAKSSEPQGVVDVQSGTQVSAQLLTTLNAKKAKPGQRVIAKVTRDVKQNGRTVIRKNARLIGHVVSAKASGKGNAGSSVEVAFDRLLEGRSSTALSAVVTSIVSVPSAPMPEPMQMQAPMAPMGGSGAGGGGLVGGVGGAVGSTVGSAVGGTSATAGAMAGSTIEGTGRMASGAAGMAGMAANAITVSNNAAGAAGAAVGATNGLASAGLGSSANASNQTHATSVFSRRKGNVELDSGTQLQLQVVGKAQAQNPKSH
jgi:hypothetical protein